MAFSKQVIAAVKENIEKAEAGLVELDENILITKAAGLETADASKQANELRAKVLKIKSAFRL